MTELIRSLIECLKKETERYRRLEVLAVQQKDLLVAGKVDALQENIRLEEKEVFALNPLVGERSELLSKIAKIEGMKVIDLEGVLKKCPIDQIEDFKKAVIELIQGAKRLEGINKGNEKLLKSALSYVNFTLKIINDGGRKKSFYPSVAPKAEENRPSLVNRVV
jgi:hypothetical protein